MRKKVKFTGLRFDGKKSNDIIKDIQQALLPRVEQVGEIGKSYLESNVNVRTGSLKGSAKTFMSDDNRYIMLKLMLGGSSPGNVYDPVWYAYAQEMVNPVLTQSVGVVINELQRL